MINARAVFFRNGRFVAGKENTKQHNLCRRCIRLNAALSDQNGQNLKQCIIPNKTSRFQIYSHFHSQLFILTQALPQDLRDNWALLFVSVMWRIQCRASPTGHGHGTQGEYFQDNFSPHTKIPKIPNFRTLRHPRDHGGRGKNALKILPSGTTWPCWRGPAALGVVGVSGCDHDQQRGSWLKIAIAFVTKRH